MKVLLVDDDTDLLDMTARRLKRKGLEVLPASNGQDAMQIFQQHSGSLQGIICDLFLGSENGIDLFEKFRKEGFQGVFVLATGDDAGDKRITQHTQADPKFACLQKPFEFETLLEILNR